MASCVMSATAVPRNPMLADNEKTVEFAKGFAGGDEKTDRRD